MPPRTFTLYSPGIPPIRNPIMTEEELTTKLINFYNLYKPDKAKSGVEQYLRYAKENGVLALKSILKNKYRCDLDAADSSSAGWHRIYQKLVEYYQVYSTDKGNIKEIYAFGRTKGLQQLDAKLAPKYGESLSEFMNRGLDSWKRNWSHVLQTHHEESVEYELKRFYYFIETLDKKFPEKQPFEILVDWATTHSRSEVNEKLLEKYHFSLDDIKMVKGTNNEERIHNLKVQLIEFFQQHDPERLGNDAYGDGQSLTGAYNDRAQKPTPQMIALDRMAKRGIFELEELDRDLLQRYQCTLDDPQISLLRERLMRFYRLHNKAKSADDINKIIEFGRRQGFDAMNKNLELTYGSGVNIDDIV